MLRPAILALSSLMLLSAAQWTGRLYAATADDSLPFPIIERFESFGIKDGFPTHKVHCVLPASDGKLWVGTWKGLMVREDGKFRKIGVEDGLSQQMVVC